MVNKPLSITEMIRKTALVLSGMLLSVLTVNASEKVIFEGYDTHLGFETIIVMQDGKYYMDGGEMEELRHKNMPKDGISLAMKDRIGRPNMYWLVLPKMVELYVNCEFGKCRFKRSIIGKCCQQ